jgi:hypothetical protein
MATMEDEEMEKKVQEYLQRKGLRLAEVTVQGDRSRVPTSAPRTCWPGSLDLLPQLVGGL